MIKNLHYIHTSNIPLMYLNKIFFYFYFRMNKLTVLPRGFGAFPVLEVLDLTYNNLSERSLPGNFFCLSKSDLREITYNNLSERSLPGNFFCLSKSY